MNEESSYERKRKREREREKERTEVGDDASKDVYVCVCARECVRYAAGRRERKGWHEDFSAESRRKKRFAVCTRRGRITGEEQERGGGK